MHVWRLPLVNLAALIAFAVVVIAWEVLAWFRRHSSNDIGRGVIVAAGAIAALSAPFIVHAIVDPELRELASRGVYVHYGSPFYFGPTLLAAILFALSRGVVSEDSLRVLRARIAFWATAGILATANLTNWCSPGLCERFGFPFPYSWWSDAIVVFNGVNLSAGTSVLAGSANVIVLVGAAIIAARAFARPPSNSRPQPT
jgi:hypothetical protein